LQRREVRDGAAEVDGIAQAGTQEMFVLRYLQARDPRLAGEPFFAGYDPDAAWPDELQPTPDTAFPRPLTQKGPRAGRLAQAPVK
jgi:hypothetical protein